MEFTALHTLFLGVALLFVSAIAFNQWEEKALLIFLPIIAGCVYKFADSFDMLSTLVAPIIYGSLAGYTFKKKLSLQFYIITASVAAMVVYSSHYYYLLLVKHSDILLQVKEQLPELLSQARGIQLQNEFSQTEIDMVFDVLRLIMPFNFYLSTLMWASIAFMILRPFFSVFIVKKVILLQGLEFYKLHDYFVYFLIVCLAVFVFTRSDQTGIFYILAINGLLISAMLYLIQSLGIIRHFLIKKGLPLFILPLGVVAALVFSMPFLPVVAMLLTGWGILDLWADFRGLSKKSESDS